MTRTLVVKMNEGGASRFRSFVTGYEIIIPNTCRVPPELVDHSAHQARVSCQNDNSNTLETELVIIPKTTGITGVMVPRTVAILLPEDSSFIKCNTFCLELGEAKIHSQIQKQFPKMLKEDRNDNDTIKR